MQLLSLSNRLLIPGLDHLIPLNNVWLGMDLTLPPNQAQPHSFVLPVLVLVTTWLQYKSMPQPAAAQGKDGQPDQAQAMTQSMSTIMPLMFAWFSLSFSVGLSIYFVVSNLIGIVQYRFTPKKTPPSVSLLEEGEKEEEKPKRQEAPKVKTKAKPAK
jgi:YidC/Oxa1 family membrane protein insertase